MDSQSRRRRSSRQRRTRPLPPPPESHTLEVRTSPRGNAHTFDLELWFDDDNTGNIAIAPRRIRGVRDGCVWMTFDQSSPEVYIHAVTYDRECTTPGSPDLPPKDGTRAMLLGMAHAVVFMARGSWPHLRKFSLTDESTFPCLPLRPRVRTFVADMILRGSTYYERHLGAHLASADVRRCVERVKERMAESVDVDPAEFVDYLMSEPSSPSSSPEGVWLAAHSDRIREVTRDAKNAGRTWRDMFAALNAALGCSLFAACQGQLIRLFGMTKLMGALYEVDFDELPGSAGGGNTRGSSATGAIQVSLAMQQPQHGGGGRRTKRMSSLIRSAIEQRVGGQRPEFG